MNQKETELIQKTKTRIFSWSWLSVFYGGMMKYLLRYRSERAESQEEWNIIWSLYNKIIAALTHTAVVHVYWLNVSVTT